MMTVSKQSQDRTSARNLPMPNVRYRTPDDGQRRCLKLVEFYDRINLFNCSILTLIGYGHHKTARNLPMPNVQYRTPDDGQRRCPKHVEFYDRINLVN